MTESPHRPTRMIAAAGTVLVVTLLALAVAGWSLLAAEERRQEDRLRDDAARLTNELRALAVETVLLTARSDLRLTLSDEGRRLDPPPPAPFPREPEPEDARIGFLLRQGADDDAAGPAAEELLAASTEPVVGLHLALRRALDGGATDETARVYDGLPAELRSTERGVHLGLLAGQEDAKMRALQALSTRDDALAASLLVGTLGRDAAALIAAERDRQERLDRLQIVAGALTTRSSTLAAAGAEGVRVDGDEVIAVRATNDEKWTVAVAPTTALEPALARRARSSGATLADGSEGEPLPWWRGRSLVVESTGLDGFRGLVLAGIGIAALAAIVAFVAFVRAADRAARLAALRTEFVATVGHELRTPVAVIRTSAETLERGLATTDEQRAVFLGAILRESERLAGLLGNVLDFARMESGSERFRFETADLSAIARECVEARRESRLATPGRIELVVPDEPLSVECDSRAVAAALTNLIDNAVKFGGDELPVTVRVFPEDESRSPCVQVEDHGLGVPDEQKERIFERFYRDPRPAVQATRGTGIGLALCGRVAAAHGGELIVSDTPGGGATFRFVLPSGRRS